MRPSIEFAFLVATDVGCMKDSSLSIHMPKSFFTCGFRFYTLFGVVSHCVCIAWGIFPCPLHLFTLKFSCQVSAHSWR